MKMTRQTELTSSGKFVVACIVACVVFCFVKLAQAGEINIHMEWTYNGNIEETTGFKLYQENPAGEIVVVAVITGGDTRTWDGVFEAVPGRSFYYLTAYTPEIESPKSQAFPFEYMESQTPGLPPPTVIIRFN